MSLPHLHVDAWPTRLWREGEELFDFEHPQRFDSPNIPHGPLETDEPYWNGYMYFTRPHFDGACGSHVPDQQIVHYEEVTGDFMFD